MLSFSAMALFVPLCFCAAVALRLRWRSPAALAFILGVRLDFFTSTINEIEMHFRHCSAILN
jgi:hypothetical protein